MFNRYNTTHFYSRMKILICLLLQLGTALAAKCPRLSATDNFEVSNVSCLTLNICFYKTCEIYTFFSKELLHTVVGLLMI